MIPAASVFLVVGLAYAAWCLVAAINNGLHIGTLGMALLSGALCYQGLTLLEGSSHARVLGIVSAAGLSIGCIATATLVLLPWLSGPADPPIPSRLWPPLAVLLATAAAFAVAAAFLICDRHARPNFRMERKRHG
jgi:uncharacterized membrane protein YbhN (UPF0104 family)